MTAQAGDGRASGFSRGSLANTRPAFIMLAAALAIGLAGVLLFHIRPNLDLYIGRELYLGNHRFIGSGSLTFSATRLFFKIAFAAICGLTLAGIIMTFRSSSSWLTLSARKWVYLALCLLAGPLLITNLGLKDHWGRARPANVVEFGGSKEFSPPLVPSDQCPRNCSFISGEASQIYLVFFAIALVLGSRPVLLTLGGVLVGSVAGFVRMAQGGHFFSDVLFAGVVMAAVAAAIYIVWAAVMPLEKCHLDVGRT